MQTHISYVLIAGEHVYKLKKPLDLGFLDFRTLDARRIACEREVALNSRLCAEAYLGVVPIIEMPEGPAIGESAEGREPLDWAVHMRRLPDESFLDRRLLDGHVPANTAALLAQRLVEFHEAAATNDEVARYGSVELIAANWQENFDQVRPYIGRTIAQADFDSLVSYVDRVLREDAGTFARRAKRDRVRDGHGDLRCDSVSLGDDGSLCIIDCIEFNDRFRYADVASDLAFLLMDLDRLGASWLADEVLTQYLARSFDESLPLVLPFYRCYRAFVRGKVHGFEMDEAEIPAEQRARAELTARRCFDLA
ncbi:MAG TPA: phosphotransferase, partial [Dehalococcoidia bacterium]|nr:phosphotransferase [Dehalococcoidia bacterium]